MKRNIIRIGNSLGFIIPSTFLEELGVSQKDEVEIEFHKEMKMVTIKDKEATSNENPLEVTVKKIVDDYLNKKGL
ncbi:AbrB/MazE/SpoVT family DNA-binding domain-containing protein [Bacillus sp. EB600]|uniref:AbrB/MazE/SpoVT family DNA-binding domain-containing protein n=1 Tax=Bacillus sp. EB600 TaxID=2806345 RepID=UPI002108B30D|nr:AbrB/MazE/SpoVT family DNA-binding domain-containing protein [Bacillus sp. EB600]MCQ6281027.1 AbrB/MazE/SpoVT family DNA-binding domain-containing protein [Bacillus sp. EB600]